MREELYAHVGGLHLTAIGIETSSNYGSGKISREGWWAFMSIIKDNPEKL